MIPITDVERDQATNILKALQMENGENYQKLKNKSKWEKMSLIAVLLQWGHPRGWFESGIKECPFCGDTKPYIDSFDNGIIRMYYSKCPKCLTTSGRYPTKGLTIKNWNTRNG